MTFGFGFGLPRGGSPAGLPAFAANFLSGALPQGATFSRGTIATQYNSSGLLQMAPSNIALQSQTFTVAPWGTNNCAHTANATTAPDGTLTGDSLVENSANSLHYTYQNSSLTAGTTMTVSFYAKANTRTRCMIRENSITGSYISFNLLAGSILTTNGSVTGTITSAGNGWYRCTMTQPIGTTGSTQYGIFLLPSTGSVFADATYLGDGVSGLYLWGYQLEQSPTATTYTPTTSAAVYGPRFDYDPNPANYVQQNLLKYSQQLTNGIWTVDNSGAPAVNPIVSASSAQAPDGTATATEVVLNRSTGTYSRIQQVFAALIGTAYTFSVYMRTVSGGTSNVGIRVDAIAQNCVVTGTWQQFSITVSPTVINPAAQILLFSSIAGNDQFADILVWGAQLSVGSTVFPYLATTSTAQTICAPKGLLIEESRINLQLNSTTGASWVATNATSTANAVVAPDGTTTATSVIESATGPLGHYFQSQTANTLTNATAYTTSVYAKANGRTFVCVQGDISAGFLGNPQFFDLGAGAVVTPLATGVTSAAIQPVGNGWYRCSVTATSTGVAAAVGVWLATNGTTNNYTGDGVSGAYFWGAQQELGAFSTSYIPTTAAAAVTRNQDNLSVPVGSWFNATAGTLVVQASPDEAPAADIIVRMAAVLYDTTAYTNALRLERLNGAWRVVQTVAGTPTVASGAWTTGVTGKLGAVYINAGSGASFNGAAVASIAGSVPTGITTLAIGGNAANNNAWCGHIQSFSYYNYTMTNTQLQAITT